LTEFSLERLLWRPKWMDLPVEGSLISASSLEELLRLTIAARPGYVVLGQPSDQRATRDSEHLCGAALVPRAMLQRVNNPLTFRCLLGYWRLVRSRTHLRNGDGFWHLVPRLVGDVSGEVHRQDHVSAREERSALDYIAQFTDVAWPGIVLQV